MKRCPSCSRTYTDTSLNFCLEDGTPLVPDAPSLDPRGTARYPDARSTGEPPPTEIYRQNAPVLNQVPEMSQPHQWSPTPQQPYVPPRKKSNAVWWILGGIAVVVVIGIGAVIMIIALASIGSENSNTNNSNANLVANRNTNTNTNANVNVNANENANSNTRNSNTASLPSSFSDDFSTASWNNGNYKVGDFWYAGDEYHIRARDKTFVVMYAPNDSYNTENATIRITTRSVDTVGPKSGYGLVIHGEKKDNQLEDYALLIYTSNEPQYEIVMHKGGNQTAIVPWTKSTTIRPGTATNQLEMRVKGTEISCYINGQYITRFTDTENYKRGLAGLYSSDNAEVVFDDLEIAR